MGVNVVGQVFSICVWLRKIEEPRRNYLRVDDKESEEKEKCRDRQAQKHFHSILIARDIQLLSRMDVYHQTWIYRYFPVYRVKSSFMNGNVILINTTFLFFVVRYITVLIKFLQQLRERLNKYWRKIVQTVISPILFLLDCILMWANRFISSLLSIRNITTSISIRIFYRTDDKRSLSLM